MQDGAATCTGGRSSLVHDVLGQTGVEVLGLGLGILVPDVGGHLVPSREMRPMSRVSPPGQFNLHAASWPK